MDPLTPLFARFSLNARVFYSGHLCGSVNFDREPGLGYLHVLRAGRLSVTQPGQPALEIAEPAVLFYAQPTRHRFEVDDPNGASLVCASIAFGAGLGNPLLRGLPELLLVPMARIAGVEPTLDLLFDEAFAERPGRQAAIDRMAEFFLILLLRYAIDAGVVGAGALAALADRRLARAVTAMHERPEEPWTLDGLAQLAGMSRARFAAQFRERTGVTALDYLTDWRITVAQTLLKRGKPLKLVAPMVGYSSPIALTRVFTRRVGLAPGQWRAGMEG